jgi:hypothetical protein
MSVAEKDRLRAAIKAYRESAGNSIDENGQKVLDRLVTGDDAAEATKAFAKFKADARAARMILTTCIEADRLNRSFSDRLNTETESLSRLEELDKSVANLSAFVSELNQGPTDRLAAYATYGDDDLGSMKLGLHLVKEAVKDRRRIANETILRIGATNKTQGKAAETAAIGWLEEGVRRACGKPHHEATALLAQIAMGCNVSVDRLIEAGRTRIKREWRQKSSGIVRFWQKNTLNKHG